MCKLNVKIKKTLIGVLIVLQGILVSASTAVAQTTTLPQNEAPIADPILRSLSVIREVVGFGNSDPFLIISQLLRTALTLLSLIFFIMILAAGFTWMTSGGDEEAVGKAKKTLINAIIGLIIILSAQSIVGYVIRLLVSATNQPGANPTL